MQNPPPNRNQILDLLNEYFYQPNHHNLKKLESALTELKNSPQLLDSQRELCGNAIDALKKYRDRAEDVKLTQEDLTDLDLLPDERAILQDTLNSEINDRDDAQLALEELISQLPF